MIEMTLEEDLPEEFRGGSLRLNGEKLNDVSKPDTPDKLENSDNSSKLNNNNNCQWGFSLISPFSSIPNKITETIWSSKPKEIPAPNKDNSLQPSVCIKEDANNFFTFRDGVVEKAMKECVDQFLDLEADGPLIATFLLTQINHWDTDKERLVLLTSKCLVIVKYDFIALKRLAYKKLPLDMVDQIIIGDLIYPNTSLIPDRKMKGVRIMFNRGEPVSFKTAWNPFTEDVPFWTFTYHPLYFHKDCADENLKKIYNLDDFLESLCSIVASIKKNEETCIYHRNIILENYLGFGSIIHNRNSLGFFKVRGKFSF